MVCGDNPLALRLADELITRYSAEVTVILAAVAENQGPAIAELPGVTVIEAGRLTATVFEAAGLANAEAVALVAQDDAGNIDAALLAQELNPTLRIVIRMFNESLAAGILPLLHDGAALSESALATPGFVAAALGEGTPTYLRLPDRTLFVARRRDIDADSVVCGLAVLPTDDAPELLPADEQRADLVLTDRPGHARRPVLPRPERTAGTGTRCGRCRF